MCLEGSPRIQKRINYKESFLQFRSYSQEKLLEPTNQCRSDSTHSVDLFSLVVPANHDSSLSSLLCSICSLPMMRPKLLPCQHTFCHTCLEDIQQTRPGSLPTHSTNSLSLIDNQVKTITCPKCSRNHRIQSVTSLKHNESVELLVNTLLCRTCLKLYPSNQLDTCFHCFDALCPKCYDQHIENHQNELKTTRKSSQILSIEETIKPNRTEKETIFNENVKSEIKASDIETVDNQSENSNSSSPTNTKKKSRTFLRKLITSTRHRHSTDDINSKPSSPVVKRSSSAKLPYRPKIVIETILDIPQTIESNPSVVPITPVRQFINFNEYFIDRTQHIEQCKQRQSELNRSVDKLIEVFSKKTNETIQQISQYWMYLKQFLFDQLQAKTNRFHIFNHLIKTCCSTSESQKQIVSYFEQNDEIKASLQVLLTTLLIVNQQQTQLVINQSFDREEQTTLGRLRRHYEFFLASYAEELSFIHERIRIYESRFATWRNFSTTDLDSLSYEWTHIIEHDYPVLIEKISNDFITKTPQIEKSLFEMLKNMKKRLLSIDHQGTSQRSSVVSL
ncbi:hypothetical protein I4U23_010372 [Adineta vaga]|nr:hypothetical protein I4U23_010372 [Adineta vaga]